MTQQEIEEFKKRRTRTTQRLIRVVIEEMADFAKGRLTTRGVIYYLQDAINYLETRALLISPEDFLEKQTKKDTKTDEQAIERFIDEMIKTEAPPHQENQS